MKTAIATILGTVVILIVIVCIVYMVYTVLSAMCRGILNILTGGE